MIFVKGLAMGAADVVPGVSGGTIALVTGIYQELIYSLKGLSPTLLGVLRHEGFKAFWQKMNGSFLCAVFAGIVTSIGIFAHFISFMIDHYAIYVWGFFFALIGVSAWLVQKHVGQWSVLNMSGVVIGTIVAFSLTTIVPMSIDPRPLTVFLAGCVAISAMLLPGVSGSFLLLMMGLYVPIMNAVKALDFVVLGAFGAGCLCGLVFFSHFLSWLLSRFHCVTMAVLTGFMLGSLNKVWPWQVTLRTRTSSRGEVVPLVQENVSPELFTAHTGEASMFGSVMAVMLGTVLVVLTLEYWGQKRSQLVSSHVSA